MMGISRSSFHAWIAGTDMLKKPFREIVSLGKEASEAWWLQQGRENIDNRSFNNSLWALNMVNRFSWNSNKNEEKKEIEYKGAVESTWITGGCSPLSIFKKSGSTPRTPS